MNRFQSLHFFENILPQIEFKMFIGKNELTKFLCFEQLWLVASAVLLHFIMPAHGVKDEAALDRLVLRLLRMGAPKIFAWLVVLVYFNSSMPEVSFPFTLIEVFAGEGAISKTGANCGLSVASLDLKFGEKIGPRHSRSRKWRTNPFDMSTDVGFAFLEFARIHFFVYFSLFG